MDGNQVIENEKYGLPFSFFNVVFINPKFHKQENRPEILAHEKVHIRENHWFDLLIIELLTVIFWLNPFICFFERSIKQNHEYLPDQGVLAQGNHVGWYQGLFIFHPVTKSCRMNSLYFSCSEIIFHYFF